MRGLSIPAFYPAGLEDGNEKARAHGACGRAGPRGIISDGYSALAACRGGQPVRCRFKRVEWLAVSVVVAASAALLLSGPIYSRRYHSCALCRLGRIDYRSLGASWSKYEETACATWYR